MAIAIGIWSQHLTPGKEVVISPPVDLRITNVALADVLADANGRTVVKFSYSNFSAGPGEESDDDDMSESMLSTVLCSLTAGKIEQTTTDIVLQANEDHKFVLVGKNSVYLTGNFIDQTSVDSPPYDVDDMDSDMDSEDAYDLREVSSDVEMDLADIDELSDSSRFEEVDDEPLKNQKRPRTSDANEESITKKSKKQKTAIKQATINAGNETKLEDKPEKKTEKKEKKALKKDGSKDGKDSKADKPQSGEKEAKKKSVEIAGGVKIRDVKTGEGPMAKKGNTVSVRYYGKLDNGKVFDQNSKGKPFTFRLGQGEVIKGWDEGVVGMQVGGERVLIIPPSMAYGKKAQAAIPANSTLHFEIKLLRIS